MRSKPPQTPSRIDRLVRRARWTIVIERLWPFAVLALGTVVLFVAVSWLGVWPALPRPLRILGVVLFAAALGMAVVLGVRGARVTRAEALRRLDRDSGLPHRLLSTAEDRLANQAGDPVTLALWEMSRRRIEGVVRRVRVAPPAPRLAARDPFALRALAALVLVAAAFVAGPHKDGLLASAFDWRSAGAAADGFRVDAWIDPPGYTGKPPVVLFAREPAGRAGQEITAPAHSTVVVRASGAGSLEVRTEGALRPVADAAPAPVAAKGAATAQVERRLILDGNGRLVVSRDGTTLGDVALKATPDLPPTIALVGAPKATARGGLTLAYRIDDDYGVTGADASFSDPMIDGHPIAGRSLVPPPKLALDLPPTPGALGTGQTTGDLSDHPWAGVEVTVVLSTRDEGGNVGLSAPMRTTLPARPFNNPLARALVEQRQDLVFDPDHRDTIATALDGLMVDPDQFGTSKAVYLGLYTARQRLAAAKTDDDLIALSDYLWQMALKIEDGTLDQTARDLRAAEQALRDALQKGASSDEIRTLTENLRRQMDKFVAELQRKGQQKQARADRNGKAISQHDLEKMMQRMEEMAQSGQTSEAQRMLDELQNLLDNLQTAENGSPSDQADREMNKQMSELDRMTRDQQGLRDDTFKKGQRSQSPDGSQSDPQDDEAAGEDAGRDAAPQPGDQAGNDDLQGQQQALRQRLQQLQKSMRQLGMKGEQGLDDAGEAMKDAEGALGQGPAGNRKAVEAQGRALAGLQKGASGLAEQMAQGQSDQSGEGQGHGGQVGQGSSGDSENDPLGRKRESRGMMETQGNAIDEGVAARAQRVLQELRRRLGDPNRPTEEMDYLERLLRRN